jgi:hypothetical protein
MKRLGAMLLFILCCTLCSAQQTSVNLKFFSLTYNKLSTIPGIDGNSKLAVGRGIRLWDDGVKWMHIQAARDVYDWAKMDDWISKAEAQKQDVLYTFGGTPTWAAIDPAPPPQCLNSTFPNACSIPKLEDYKAFVTALVTRYKGRIAFYETWNEPDCKCFWTGTIQQMADYAKEAATIIRSIDPAAVILSPSFHGVSMSSHFRPLVEAHPWHEMFDIVNVHMRAKPNYPPENFLAVWQMVVDELARDKIDAAIWDDEHGITTGDAITDPDTLASFAARELMLRASVPLERQYIYFWDANDNLGLQANLAGTAWNTITGWLQEKSTSKVRVEGTVYRMLVGNGMVLWDSSQTCTSSCCSTKEYALGQTKFTKQTDITGTTTPIADQKVHLGLKPIYLQ